MTVPATLSITAASVGLLAALLSLGMSSAPGRLELRWFAVIAACAALFNLSTAVVTLRLPLQTILIASRFCLFFGGLHSAAWLKYYAAQLRRPLTRLERVLVGASLVFALLSLVPGVVLASTLYTRTVPWLGVTYADPPPTTFGLFAFGYHLAVLVLLFGRYAARVRSLEFRAPSIALGALIGGVIHDALASLGIIDGPYVLDFALLVVVLSVGGSLTRSFVTNARALQVSSHALSDAHAELVKRERLAGLGELAAVVAHEVRNPLAVVFNAVASLRKAPTASADNGALLEILQEEAERLRDIVSDLIEFARPRTPQFAPAALHDIVQGAVDAAREGVGAPPADVVVELTPIASALCDERLVRRAVVNLVTNALQAPARTSPVRIVLSRLDGDAVIVVSDDGAGVPAENRKRIFTPFYSTRPTGTGLGLAIVRSAADAHGGDVALSETAGGGATFTFLIPLQIVEA